MRHPLLLAWTGLRLRLSFRRDGYNFRQINGLMSKFDEAKFDEAVVKADELTDGGMSKTLDASTSAIGDGTFLQWLTDFLNSEFGQFLLELLKALLLGLVGGASISMVVKSVAVLFFFLFAPLAYAGEYFKSSPDLPPVVEPKCDCFPCLCSQGQLCGKSGCPATTDIPKPMPAVLKPTSAIIGADHLCPHCKAVKVVRKIDEVYKQYSDHHSHYCPVHGEIHHSVEVPNFTYSLPSSGCSNGACYAPARTGWYPGKFLGR